ncbi:MAG: hypothetical protein K2X08_00795 [Chlamydiales bacterium]|nr:hypothetical protein [Chlamydiales bacterium]MBY0529840.1 hypothetical protein [Rhabdochlamydiaceae bacterium]
MSLSVSFPTTSSYCPNEIPELNGLKTSTYFIPTPRLKMIRTLVIHVLSQVFYVPREGEVKKQFFERIGISAHAEIRSQFLGIYTHIKSSIPDPMTAAQKYVVEQAEGFQQSLEVMGKTYDVCEEEFFNLVNYAYQFDFTKEVAIHDTRREIGERILHFSCKLMAIGKRLLKLKRDADLIEKRTMENSSVATYLASSILPPVMRFPHLFREGECTLSQNYPGWKADFQKIAFFYQGTKTRFGYFSTLKSLRDYLNNSMTTLVIVKNLFEDVIQTLDKERQIDTFLPPLPITQVQAGLFDIHLSNRDLLSGNDAKTSETVKTFIRQEASFIYTRLSSEEKRLLNIGETVIRMIDSFNRDAQLLSEPSCPEIWYQRFKRIVPEMDGCFFCVHQMSAELNHMAFALNELYFSQLNIVRILDLIDFDHQRANPNASDLEKIDLTEEIDSLTISSLSGKTKLALSSSFDDRDAIKEFKLKCLDLYTEILNTLNCVKQRVLTVDQEMLHVIKSFELHAQELNDLAIDLDRFGRFFPVPDKMRAQEEVYQEQAVVSSLTSSSSSVFSDEVRSESSSFLEVPSASSLLGPDSPPREEKNA